VCVYFALLAEIVDDTVKVKTGLPTHTGDCQLGR
jgi:hypothetical protein